MLCAACLRVIMAASNESLVEGIGDEVLLFGAFLFLSACMVCYVSLRGERRGPEQAARGREGEQQQRDNGEKRSSYLSLAVDTTVVQLLHFDPFVKFPLQHKVVSSQTAHLPQVVAVTKVGPQRTQQGPLLTKADHNRTIPTDKTRIVMQPP